MNIDECIRRFEDADKKFSQGNDNLVLLGFDKLLLLDAIRFAHDKLVDMREFEQNMNAPSVEEKSKKKKKSRTWKNGEYFPDDELLNERFTEFVEMRRLMKKPLTDRAITLAITRLERLSVRNGVFDCELAAEIIDQSLMFSWQSFYALKDESSSRRYGRGGKRDLMQELFEV